MVFIIPKPCLTLFYGSTSCLGHDFRVILVYSFDFFKLFNIINLFNSFQTKEIFRPFSSKNPKLKFFKRKFTSGKMDEFGKKNARKNPSFGIYSLLSAIMIWYKICQRKNFHEHLRTVVANLFWGTAHLELKPWPKPHRAYGSWDFLNFFAAH